MKTTNLLILVIAVAFFGLIPSTASAHRFIRSHHPRPVCVTPAYYGTCYVPAYYANVYRPVAVVSQPVTVCHPVIVSRPQAITEPIIVASPGEIPEFAVETQVIVIRR